ncbi:MAG: hypothetical protein AB8B58_01615 [Roseobacter sp.]
MSPPRLHVIPALGSPKALILRSGPSDMVSTLLWNREANTYTFGQWLTGRFYEHRCDLSPDGRHMIYCAGDGTRRWTALSRAPWLTALKLLPHESASKGGGAFTATGALWVNGPSDQTRGFPDDLAAAPADAFPRAADGFHAGTLYVHQMIARGWTHQAGQGHDAVLQKQLTPTLRLGLSVAAGPFESGLMSNSYTLHRGAAHQPQPAWEWADIWGESLQFAIKGALFQADFIGDKLGPARRLRDFNGMKYKPRRAPYEGVGELVS